jgi:hypothetical protein
MLHAWIEARYDDYFQPASLPSGADHDFASFNCGQAFLAVQPKRSHTIPQAMRRLFHAPQALSDSGAACTGPLVSCQNQLLIDPYRSHTFSVIPVRTAKSHRRSIPRAYTCSRSLPRRGWSVLPFPAQLLTRCCAHSAAHEMEGKESFAGKFR